MSTARPFSRKPRRPSLISDAARKKFAQNWEKRDFFRRRTRRNGKSTHTKEKGAATFAAATLRRFLYRSPETVVRPFPNPKDFPDENFRRTPFATRAPRSVLRRRRRGRSVERSGRDASRRFRYFVEPGTRFLLLRDRSGPGLRRAAPAASAILRSASAAALLLSGAAILLLGAATALRRPPAARRSGPATGRPALRRPPITANVLNAASLRSAAFFISCAFALDSFALRNV